MFNIYNVLFQWNCAVSIINNYCLSISYFWYLVPIVIFSSREYGLGVFKMSWILILWNPINNFANNINRQFLINKTEISAKMYYVYFFFTEPKLPSGFCRVVTLLPGVFYYTSAVYNFFYSSKLVSWLQYFSSDYYKKMLL